jgi:hypothetical protein
MESIKIRTTAGRICLMPIVGADRPLEGGVKAIETPLVADELTANSAFQAAFGHSSFRQWPLFTQKDCNELTFSKPADTSDDLRIKVAEASKMETSFAKAVWAFTPTSATSVRNQ